MEWFWIVLGNFGVFWVVFTGCPGSNSAVRKRAQALLPEVLAVLPPPGIAGLRLHDVLFTPLEWAAKKGNLDVVNWLCEEPRTQALVHAGAPIGWAVYAGRLEVARALRRHGADAAATDDALWGGLSPLLVAAQNGQLEMMKWLVDEVGQDVRVEDSRGFGVVRHTTLPVEWEECRGHPECKRWAEERLAPSSIDDQD